MMKNIYECRLMKTAQVDDRIEITASDLIEQYNEFRGILKATLFGDAGYLSIDAVLNETLFILVNRSIRKKRGPAIGLCIKQAIWMTKIAIRHNEKRLTNPDLFVPLQSAARSPLYWNSKYTKRDLIELISALDLVMAAVDAHGRETPFKRLVEAFSSLFNVSLDYAYKERKEIEYRTDGNTSFVRLLFDELKQ